MSSGIIGDVSLEIGVGVELVQIVLTTTVHFSVATREMVGCESFTALLYV